MLVFRCAHIVRFEFKILCYRFIIEKGGLAEDITIRIRRKGTPNII